MTEENVLGEINIKITDQNVLWDSEMSFQDVHWWLSVLVQMMMNTFLLEKPEDGS